MTTRDTLGQRGAGLAALVCAAVLLAACTTASSSPSSPGSAGSAGGAGREGTSTSTRSGHHRPHPRPNPHKTQDAPPGTALVALAAIPVKGRAPMTGYTRDQFGPTWTDDNGDRLGHNGCDTRNDILARDLTRIGYRDGNCVVATGLLHDPYSGRDISFLRGETTSTAVEIDHVVALGDAWQTGAQRLSYVQRVDYANDPGVLLAVDGPLNEAKGDADAGTWLPPNKSYRCEYVARQVTIKTKYRLWMTAAEQAAAARVLASCPNQPLPRIGAPITLHRDSGPSTDPPTGTGTYYPTCDAARATGAAPLHRGQPGYRPDLDGDGDGLACES